MRKYFFYKNKGWFWSSAVLCAAVSIFAVLQAAVLNRLFDVIAQGKTEQLPLMAEIIVGYAVIMALLTVVKRTCMAKFQRNAVYHLRQDLTAGLLRMDIPAFQEKSSAKYTSLLNNDVTTVQNNYFALVFEIAGSLVSIVAALVYLFLMNWMVAVVAIACTVTPTLCSSLFGKKLSKMQTSISETSGAYTAGIQQIFGGFEVIKSYLMEKTAQKNHDGQAYRMENAKCAQGVWLGGMYGVMNLISIILQFAVILFAGYLTTRGLFTVGNIVAVTNLTGLALEPAIQMGDRFGRLKSVRELNGRMTEICDTPAPEAQAYLPEEIPDEGTIELKDVSFAYDENHPALQNFSYRFEQGKKYAVVGTSGCGKSTLLKLMLRYYTDYQGGITVGGEDCRSVTPEQINRLCAYMHQSVFLFDDSLRNNITLHEEVPQERLEDCAREAGLQPVLEKLPAGLDMPVGENGSAFSGGEKQRIAIARAFLKGARVLMLDEATAALDNETAYHIEDTVLSMQDVTGIVVTHRYNRELLERYDAILAIKDGRLVEAGTFRELLEAKGYFYSLFNIAA